MMERHKTFDNLSFYQCDVVSKHFFVVSKLNISLLHVLLPPLTVLFLPLLSAHPVPTSFSRPT